MTETTATLPGIGADVMPDEALVEELTFAAKQKHVGLTDDERAFVAEMAASFSRQRRLSKRRRAKAERIFSEKVDW